MVSIIVPVYNVEMYLPQCIDSILAQSYSNIEVILVDDGSTDSSLSICREYAERDERIRVYHQNNMGVSAARNTGISNARGEYIAFVDSDDLIRQDYIEKLIFDLSENNADISACDLLRFNDMNEPDLLSTEENDEKIFLSGKEAALAVYTGQSKLHIAVWAKIIKKSLFAGMEFPVGKIHEDDALTPRLLYKANKIVYSENKMYLHRKRQNSIMEVGFSEKRFDAIEAIDNNIVFFKKNNEMEIASAAERLRIKRHALYILDCHKYGMVKKIPQNLKMSVAAAVYNLYRIMPSHKFEWYIKDYYPSLEIVSAYIEKFKSFFR